jgi:hypothetical protein
LSQLHLCPPTCLILHELPLVDIPLDEIDNRIATVAENYVIASVRGLLRDVGTPFCGT